MKFILLINVKMPTIVGVLTFLSMINTTSERLKARNVFICRYFSFYEQLKFHAQLSWAWKKFYNLGGQAWSFELLLTGAMSTNIMCKFVQLYLYSHCIVSLIYDQDTLSVAEDPPRYNWNIIYWDVKNQTNQPTVPQLQSIK